MQAFEVIAPRKDWTAASGLTRARAQEPVTPADAASPSRRRTFPQAVVAIGATALLWASSAAAASDDFIYCSVQDSAARRAFYSAVFAGDYFRMQDHRQAFHAFVDARFGPTGSGSIAVCFYEPTLREARASAELKATTDRRDGYEVVRTRWSGGRSNS